MCLTHRSAHQQTRAGIPAKRTQKAILFYHIWRGPWPSPQNESQHCKTKRVDVCYLERCSLCREGKLCIPSKVCVCGIAFLREGIPGSWSFCLNCLWPSALGEAEFRNLFLYGLSGKWKVLNIWAGVVQEEESGHSVPVSVPVWAPALNASHMRIRKTLKDAWDRHFSAILQREKLRCRED